MIDNSHIISAYQYFFNAFFMQKVFPENKAIHRMIHTKKRKYIRFPFNVNYGAIEYAPSNSKHCPE